MPLHETLATAFAALALAPEMVEHPPLRTVPDAHEFWDPLPGLSRSERRLKASRKARLRRPRADRAAYAAFGHSLPDPLELIPSRSRHTSLHWNPRSRARTGGRQPSRKPP